MKDILLYVPHDGVSIDFLEEAYISLIKENFSQELLFRYMLHEADRGALEIARSTESYLRLLSPDIQVDVRTVEIPRAFCDLNRPWERSVPPALAAEVYKERYTVQIEGDRRTHLVSKKSIHIHTMCGYSPIYTWNFTPETTEHELEKFLTTCYSGRERHIDLLTHTVEGVEIGDLDIARSIGWRYEQDGFLVDTNSAYQLKSGYPATELMSLCPSLLIEFPKHLLATADTTHSIDTSQIVLDTEKIDRMGRILAEGIIG